MPQTAKGEWLATCSRENLRQLFLLQHFSRHSWPAATRRRRCPQPSNCRWLLLPSCYAVVERFDAYPAARLLGGPAPGYSSGQALAAIEEMAAQVLPEGLTLAWNAQAFLEKQTESSTAGLYLLGVLMVFLILAAQYERLSLQLAVSLSVPFSTCLVRPFWSSVAPTPFQEARTGGRPTRGVTFTRE